MARLESVSLALYAYVKRDRCVPTSTPIVHHFVLFLESSLLSAHVTYRLVFQRSSNSSFLAACLSPGRQRIVRKIGMDETSEFAVG
jgi:hypothetical protein